VQFICHSHTTTMCADPIGSGNILTPSKTPENNWQLMRAQPKLASAAKVLQSMLFVFRVDSKAQGLIEAGFCLHCNLSLICLSAHTVVMGL